MANSKFVKFPSIEKFSDVNQHVKRHYELENRPTVHYRGKVKLHGTNAGIRVDSEGTVTALKRSDICTIDNDNAGFARWVESIKDKLPELYESVVIFGEWAGPGVQKKVAVSQIPEKTFFVFAVLNLDTGHIAVDPDRIKDLLQEDNLPFEIIPWAKGTDVVIDFRLQSSMEAALKNITGWVDECDKIDPYIKDIYNIEGVGEGYVFVPFVDEMELSEYSNYIFKAKGESHAGKPGDRTKAALEIDPVVQENAIAFAKAFITDIRCEQGVAEACGGEPSMKNIGQFMAWIGPDVKKESVNELEASGLEWKQVSKEVNAAAREWFIKRVEQNV